MIVADLVRVFKPGQEFSIERRALGKYICKNEELQADEDLCYRNELIFRGTREDYFSELQTQYELSASQSLQHDLMHARLHSRSFDVVDFDLLTCTIVILDPERKLKIN